MICLAPFNQRLLIWTSLINYIMLSALK